MKKNWKKDIQIDEIPVDDGVESVKKAKKRKKKEEERRDDHVDDWGFQGEQERLSREELRKIKNKPLIKASYFFVLIFFSMIAYLVYFQVYRADGINANSYNTKKDSQQEKIIRGSIYSSDGEILAGTNVDADGNETRLYPFDNVFSHVVGYASNGRSGIESIHNNDLLVSHASILDQLQAGSDTKIRGDNLYLTLDSSLQRACYDALGSYRGAVVVLEAKTGKVLAMVSKPDFNPNTISQDWESLISDTSGSSLFNRATQGQYPPGSTFKILTTLAYLREHPDDYQDYSYTCQGVISREDVSITCYGGAVHGTQTLGESFLHSCNTSFADIGMEIDNSGFIELCQDFLFNQSPLISLPASQSLFKLDKNASYGEEMMTAIGQGDTVVSPLQMALITQTVANGGVMMRPYYLDHIETYDGNLVTQYEEDEYKRLMSEEEAKIIGGFMERTVLEGTASGLSGREYTVAGKTGSAEYETNGATGTHSWFTGYTNVEDPEIVISVIAEDGGSGSSTAVPIAQMVMNAYYYGY